MGTNTAREAAIMRGTNSFELPNPLHKYANYNALFTISGLREKDLQDGSYLTNPVTNVVARSSGIGPERLDARNATNAGRGVFRDKEDSLYRNTGGAGGGAGIGRDAVTELIDDYTDSIEILRRNHDVFIENVNILSVIAPNTERNLSNFTKMEFEIHEPYGITFIEKVRAATFQSGFKDYQDAPLLLTIEFRGFDENGKQLKQGMSETRKVPILIARVDFDVNEGGARYNIVAVPYSDVGFDDRFKQLRTRVDLTFNDFADWKTAFELALQKQMEDEIEEKVRQYPDKYRLELDDKIRYSKELKKYAFTIQSTHADATVQEQTARDQIGTEAEFGYGAAAKAEQTQTADSGTTIPKAFEDWMRNQPGFFDISQDFWRAYLTMAGYKLPEKEEDRIIYINKLLTDKQKEQELKNLFLQYQYVPWFKIKSTVYTDTSKLDSVTKMHPKEIVYKAIPYKIHVLKLLATGLSIGKVRWDKLVRKNYDYIYTGDNVDVQGLRINYKSAYYMRNVRGNDKSENEKGIKKVVSNLVTSVFGAENYPEPLLPLRSYPTNIKGRSTVENFRPGGEKSQEFFDYLTNPEADMMKIELDILGDPHYICQDVLSCLKRLNNKKTEQVIKIDSDFDDNQFGSFNADQYMALMNLRYRLPADINEKEGTMFSGTKKYREENLFFNGVYQVVKVESKFDSGQFLQTLTCVRMNNQQGQGLAPTIIANSVKGYTDEKTKDFLKNKKKIDDLKETYREFDELFGQ